MFWIPQQVINRKYLQFINYYSQMFSRILPPLKHLTVSSSYRSHFHPCTPHTWQRREKWRQVIFLLPGEVLWDGPESCDTVPHRAHLPGVYTVRSVFVLVYKHNEKKTSIDMKTSWSLLRLVACCVSMFMGAALVFGQRWCAGIHMCL